MVGDYVWTEAAISDGMQKRSVGLGAYRCGHLTTWTILQKDDPDHLGMRCNALPEHQMALITSGCAPSSFDCHWVTLYVEHNVTREEKPYIAAEGRVNENREEHDVGGVSQASHGSCHPYR